MKITKKTKLSELLEKNEDAAGILFEAGMGCVGCSMAMQETVEDGCVAHGMDKKDIEELIDKLNGKKEEDKKEKPIEKENQTYEEKKFEKNKEVKFRKRKKQSFIDKLRRLIK